MPDGSKGLINQKNVYVPIRRKKFRECAALYMFQQRPVAFCTCQPVRMQLAAHMARLED
jgi:hypothetical protein